LARQRRIQHVPCRRTSEREVHGASLVVRADGSEYSGHIPCFDAMFCDKPELIDHTPIAHRSTTRFSALTPGGFQKRVARRHNADRKQNLDRWIQQILLEQMN